MTSVLDKSFGRGQGENYQEQNLEANDAIERQGAGAPCRVKFGQPISKFVEIRGA
jgi:hypothetical protein